MVQHAATGIKTVRLIEIVLIPVFQLRILNLCAILRNPDSGQQRQTKEFLLPHRPGPVELKSFFFEPISKTKEHRNWRDPDPYSVGGLNVEVEEDPRLEANIEEHLYSVLRLRVR
jgi:hypothetical protein